MDRLSELLKDVLPKNAEEAVSANELITRLRRVGLPESEWSDAGLKTRFSQLKSQETSVIARRDGRHGYYLRPNTLIDGGTSAAPSRKTSEADPHAGRDGQREEKFRAIYMAWCDRDNELPVLIEHTRANRQLAGMNRWKFPDVVAVRWEVLEFDSVGRPILNEAILSVRQSLGEQSFRLSSTELKVEITASNLRESFFQCVSNSRWSHSARLAIASDVADEAIANELRRLGSSYGVSVISFSLTNEDLDKLPKASEITSIEMVEEKLARPLVKTTLVLANDRESLDWEHIRDVQQQHDDYELLFKWISKSMKDSKPHKFNTWRDNLR